MLIWWCCCRFCCILQGIFSCWKSSWGKGTRTWLSLSNHYGTQGYVSVISLVQVHVVPCRWIRPWKGVWIGYALPPPNLPPHRSIHSISPSHLLSVPPHSSLIQHFAQGKCLPMSASVYRKTFPTAYSPIMLPQSTLQLV